MSGNISVLYYMQEGCAERQPEGKKKKLYEKNNQNLFALKALAIPAAALLTAVPVSILAEEETPVSEPAPVVEKAPVPEPAPVMEEAPAPVLEEAPAKEVSTAPTGDTTQAAEAQIILPDGITSEDFQGNDTVYYQGTILIIRRLHQPLWG